MMTPTESYVTLSYEDISQGEVTTSIVHRMRQDGTDWESMLQAYINFLRGIGYIIPPEEDRV